MKSASYCPFSEYMPAASTKLADAFVTEIPTAFTSVGSRPSTLEMRFCTSTAATSMLRVMSKVIVTLLDPSLPLDDVM